MTNRGFLVRFIDLGLIVLFGFIMISDIENLSHVDLSTNGDAPRPESSEADLRRVVSVGIAPDGSFAIGDPAAETVLAEGVTRPEELERMLRALRDRSAADDRELLVLISPHEASIVQRTVDVMDACDRLDVAKSLQTDLGLGGSR